MDRMILWIIIVVILLFAYKKAERLVKAMEAEDIRQTNLLENEGIEERKEEIKEE